MLIELMFLDKVASGLRKNRSESDISIQLAFELNEACRYQGKGNSPLKGDNLYNRCVGFIESKLTKKTE